MRENLNHIISKFSWDTSFDRKEKAFELQERLSGWSRFVMPNEVGDIFNKVCPPDQTWRIQSLEIDLGKIDFDNLELELSAKLRSQLHEKLTDLILYASRSGKNIEILNDDTSHINMIRDFLLNGLMPWGYKTTDGTMNQMLYHQLQSNRQQIFIMLREVGVTHLNVRKRIAWQINETNIIKIIEGLEPNNHTQIIDFSNEFTKIQTEETIVQTSIADFKKNLWLWVFNFLFTERGTVFNKVAFMKSSIIQMADHYDIGYNVLFQMIECAVDEVNKRSNIKADFLLTLKALSKESGVFKISPYKKNDDSTNFWLILESYFKTPSILKSRLNEPGFNELVISLFKQDRARFSSLVLSLGYTESLWLNAIANLNDASLEVVFCALDATRSGMLTERIYFLEKVGRGINLNINREILWQIGLKFLYNHKNALFDSALFTQYCITELSKRNNILKEHLLDRLTSAKIPNAAKTMAGLDIYTDLTSLFITELSGDDATFLINNFRDLIDALGDQLAIGAAEKDLFISLQKLLVKNIRLNPKMALEALIAYPDKEKLQQVIPWFLNDYLAQLLVKNSGKEPYSIVSSVKRILVEQAGNKKSISVAFLNERDITELALSAIILHSPLGTEKLLELIMEGILKRMNCTQLEMFSVFAGMVLDDKELRFYGISSIVSPKLQEKYKKNGNLSVLECVNQLINEPISRKAEVARILLDNLKDKEIVQLRKPGNKTGKAILNYLLRNGNELMESQLKEYKGILISRLKQVITGRIELILNELYWRCILNYADYKGNSAALVKSFRKAVFFRFPIPADNSENYSAATKCFQLKNSDKILGNELLLLIEKCLTNVSAVIIHNDKKVFLGELLNIALELHPAELRNLISKVGISEKLIDLVKAEISFEHFSLWIINDKGSAINEAIRSINQLYDLIKHISSGDVADELLNEYWKASLTLIKTNSWTAADLNKLVQTSLHFLEREGTVNAGSIISGIGRKSILLNPALRNVLSNYIPALSKLPANQENRVISKRLEQAERKGLLYELSSYLINQKSVPAWFGNMDEQEAEGLLNEIVIYYPVKFLQVLKNDLVTDAQLDWLIQIVNFKEFTRSIGRINRTKQSLLNIYEDFYKALGNVSISGVSSSEMQGFLFRKILKAWTTGNWKIISTEQIWNELVWDVCVKRDISKKVFVSSIAKVKLQLPPSLQISFGYLTDQVNKPALIIEKETNLKSPGLMTQKKDNQRIEKGGVAVKNAGLVLINSYIAMLFERLEIINEDRVFNNEASQHDAIHYLQYVVTGLSDTEEALLPLNKVLCGIPISQPVKEGIIISEEQKELIEGLIKAVINYWPAIGECSIDGFRGNWLVRDGLLIEQEDRWELIVEKRAYDLLINRSPFSFSIIKHPWMNKPLHVTWPY